MSAIYAAVRRSCIESIGVTMQVLEPTLHLSVIRFQRLDPSPAPPKD